MSKHTPGRLDFNKSVVYFSDRAGGFDIRECPEPEHNAERLAKCWNACLDIDTRDLGDNVLLRAFYEKKSLEHRADYLIQVLMGIYNSLYPPITHLQDGRAFAFRPQNLDPHEYIQALSDKIRAIPDEITKATGADHD